MKRIIIVFVAGVSTLAIAGCSDAVPTPSYTQSRAIDQDIDATHVVGPTATSPAFNQRDASPTLTPWRNEETVDQQKAEQTGQLPQ